MFTRTCEGWDQASRWGLGLGEEEEDGFSRTQRKNKERTGADVDVGLQWDVKGDFISNFYFFCQVGGKVCCERGRGGEELEGRRTMSLQRTEEQMCLQNP